MTKNEQRVAILLAVVGAFTVAKASAADPEYPQVDGPPVEESAPAFADADANADGAVSRSEAEAFVALRANFDAADADGDDELDQAEFQAAVGFEDDGERDSEN